MARLTKQCHPRSNLSFICLITMAIMMVVVVVVVVVSSVCVRDEITDQHKRDVDRGRIQILTNISLSDLRDRVDGDSLVDVADKRLGSPVSSLEDPAHVGQRRKQNQRHSHRKRIRNFNRLHAKVRNNMNGNQSDRDMSDNNFTEASTGSMNTELERVNVLIIAAMRTGSSFLGELFQQRNDFFYMFEPGLLLMRKLDSLHLTRSVIYTKLIKMLGNFYRCRFNDISFFIELLTKITRRKKIVPSLVTSQFCKKDLEPYQITNKALCDPVTERALEVACKTRANTAIKSIRIIDINLMLSEIKAPDVNLKLIHLVRDPRSMIISRLRLDMPTVKIFNATHLNSTYRTILVRYCSNWLQNYEIGHYVPFVRKNYMLVRYEDLALEPYTWARKIYDYVGLSATIPAEVHAWIDNNTSVDDPSKKESKAFSTKRDSKAVVVAWKRRLTQDMAQAIEGVGACTPLMQATGYRLIGGDHQILESEDHLLGELPTPQLGADAFDFM